MNPGIHLQCVFHFKLTIIKTWHLVMEKNVAEKVIFDLLTKILYWE